MTDWRQQMQTTVRHLAEQLKGIRPGSLSGGFVETFRVLVGGNTMPLARVATVTSQGDRIIVRPFDPSSVPAIVKALTEARLNAYALDPRTVCVGVPPISGEQRAEIAHHVKRLGEDAKVAVRLARQVARKQIATGGRGSQRAVQEATDAAIAEIDRLMKDKVDEIGT